MTPEYLEKRLRRLEKLVRRLECLVCPPAPDLFMATFEWSYSGEDLGDAPFFIITVDGQEVVNAGSCVFPNCPSPASGTFTAPEGSVVILSIGHSGGFHIYNYSITGSVDGLIDSGGGDIGQAVVPFIVTQQDYTITGTQ